MTLRANCLLILYLSFNLSKSTWVSFSNPQILNNLTMSSIIGHLLVIFSHPSFHTYKDFSMIHRSSTILTTMSVFCWLFSHIYFGNWRKMILNWNWSIKLSIYSPVSIKYLPPPPPQSICFPFLPIMHNNKMPFNLHFRLCHFLCLHYVSSFSQQIRTIECAESTAFSTNEMILKSRHFFVELLLVVSN